MKKSIFLLIAFFAIYPSIAAACDPPFFLRIHELAQSRLDSLNASPTADNVFERIVLMHNLAFYKDSKMREKAEKLLEQNFPEGKRTPLINTYAGSLRIIKASQRGKASKILKSVFGKSPLDEAREGYSQITEALEKDPGNLNIRLVRSLAAIELADYLPELLSDADTDLQWMGKNINLKDTVVAFYLYLTRAKFFYKNAQIKKSSLIKTTLLVQARIDLKISAEYICSDAYRKEYKYWEKKIF